MVVRSCWRRLDALSNGEVDVKEAGFKQAEEQSAPAAAAPLERHRGRSESIRRV